MRVVVVGTRGIPDIMGGVETHCEELYPRLVNLGCEVFLIRRSCYVQKSEKLASYKGVHLVNLFAPKNKSLEAFVHTLLAIIKAKTLKADVVHIHAVGPALFTPIARLLGLKVVFTHHGADYERDKWGSVAKSVLKYGERMGVKFAHKVIVISSVIKNQLEQEYNRTDLNLIYNGVNKPDISTQTDYIESLGLKPKSYVLALGRFVPEKGFDFLIEVFAQLANANVKLVLAGDADHADDYSMALKALANKHQVVMPGFVRAEKLNELMSHARLFLLPSYHEGLPISLLEAMSYGLDVLVSDIPANKAVGLDSTCYFENKNQESLSAQLKYKLDSPIEGVSYSLNQFDWDLIAQDVFNLYNQIK